MRALRHYEEIDLLTPELVDRDTGNRYYSVGQLQKIFGPYEKLYDNYVELFSYLEREGVMNRHALAEMAVRAYLCNMKLQQASIADYESVLSFYDDVTDRTPEIERYARWQKGKHPTAEGIKAYIQEGSLYLYKEVETIIGAIAVTMCQEEDYHAIEWSRDAADNEVAVIHILAVSPEKLGVGIGSEMIREAIRLAKSKGMKALRLDALASNTPAHKIYERLGFEYRGKQYLYAENTGWTDFYFFEYIDE